MLLGRNRRRTRRYLVVAVGLFAGTLGLMTAVGVLDSGSLPTGIDGAWVVWGAALVAVGVPAVQAYQNGGLLASLVLGLPIPLAFYLALTAFDLVAPSESVLWGVWAALSFGVPAGLLGFLLGVGARRIRRSRASDPSRSGTT